MLKNFFFFDLIFIFIILFGFGCRSGEQSQHEGWLDAICNVEKKDLIVTIEKADGVQEQVSTVGKIDAVNTSKIKFVVPEETKELMKEVYSFPGQPEELIDPLLTPLEDWQAGQEYIIDLAGLSVGTVMRYFVCVENNVGSSEQADGCFPSCYQSRILFKITESE